MAQCRVPLKRLTISAVIILIFIYTIILQHSSSKKEMIKTWWTPRQERHVKADETVTKNTLNITASQGLDQSTLRVVHLDLKGAPPKLTYLRQLLPWLAAAGCTGLLLEYEDMFPYTGLIANISARNAYTSQDIKQLLFWCHELGIVVIPLVQTFGHLEFVLKLAQYRHLREQPAFPQEVCPSEPQSWALIQENSWLDLTEGDIDKFGGGLQEYLISLLQLQEMVTQVMNMHPGARYLHIGCDEVFHLAACPKCTARSKDNRAIFAEHVVRVASWVRDLYPGVTPLIWDDMLRQWGPHWLTTSPLTALVEPVVWVYTDDIHRLLPDYIWYWYTKTFTSVWVAGAFKGANIETSVLPDTESRYENSKAWLSFISESQSRISGFVLTGWSRFDHFAVLCELLPPSVPSMLLNLVATSVKYAGQSEAHIFSQWRKSMKCSPSSQLTVESLVSDPRLVGSCSYPGVKLFLAMHDFVALKSRVDSLYTLMTEEKGWMTTYNVRHNFSSPWRLVEGFTSSKTSQLSTEVKQYKSRMEAQLSHYYDPFTVNEWIEQKVRPLEHKMRCLETVVGQLTNIDAWPRRPLV